MFLRAGTCKSRGGGYAERARRVDVVCSWYGSHKNEDEYRIWALVYTRRAAGARTTVEKLEKNYKKSSERKKERQSEEETRKESRRGGRV